MLPTVTITLDRQGVLDLDATLRGVANGAAKAITNGINKSLVTVRSGIVKALANELPFSQKKIRDELTHIHKATWGHLEGRLVIDRKPIPLYDFKPKPSQPAPNGRQKGTGVSVKVRKGKGRELLRGTFIARMSNSHVGIFERHGIGGKTDARKVARLKISERYGPTPAGVLAGAPGMLQRATEAAARDLQRKILSQVDFLLKRPKSF